jgi:hypothetical protein
MKAIRVFAGHGAHALVTLAGVMALVEEGAGFGLLSKALGHLRE